MITLGFILKLTKYLLEFFKDIFTEYFVYKQAVGLAMLKSIYLLCLFVHGIVVL